MIGAVYLWITITVLSLIVDGFSHINWKDIEYIKHGAGHIALMLIIFLTIGVSYAALTYGSIKILPDKEITNSNTDSEKDASDEESEDASTSTDSLTADSTNTDEIATENLDWAPIEEYRNTSGSYVYVTPTGSCYHLLDCPTLARTKKVKPYLLSDVPDNYSNCQVCDPLQYD